MIVAVAVYSACQFVLNYFGRENPPYFLQDMEAWLSLISAVGLGVAVIIHLIIVPSLEGAIDMPIWEAILASVIAFYFGERS